MAGIVNQETLFTAAERQIDLIRESPREFALPRLQMMAPALFTYVTAILFERRGYAIEAVDTAPPDGIHLVLAQGQKRAVVQCSPHGGHITLRSALDLAGAMVNAQANEAYLITTSQVSEQAKEWASGQPIHLIDGAVLVDWIMRSRSPRRSIFAGVRIPFVLLGSFVGLAVIALAFAAVVAFPQISSRLGIGRRPTAIWVPPTITSPQLSGTPSAAVPSPRITEVAIANPSPTPTTRAVSPSPTPTPEPTVPPTCAVETAPQWDATYRSELLGCATAPINTVWAAWQPFERGFLLWRSDTDAAYAFYEQNAGTWFQISEKWDGSSSTDRGEPPPGLQAPIRGFGYVWTLRDDLYQNLGWATDQEKGFCAQVQPFEQGFILGSSTVESCTPDNLFNQARTPGWSHFIWVAHPAGWSSGSVP